MRAEISQFPLLGKRLFKKLLVRLTLACDADCRLVEEREGAITSHD